MKIIADTNADFRSGVSHALRPLELLANTSNIPNKNKVVIDGNAIIKGRGILSSHHPNITAAPPQAVMANVAAGSRITLVFNSIAPSLHPGSRAPAFRGKLVCYGWSLACDESKAFIEYNRYITPPPQSPPAAAPAPPAPPPACARSRSPPGTPPAALRGAMGRAPRGR